MSDAATVVDEIGAGPLSRAAAVGYWLLVIEGLILLTSAPALAAVVFLAGGAGNAPLIALCFVPLGPALSAAVFAWRVFLTDRDLEPARHFWRGYRLNWRDVLRWWVPMLAGLTVVAVNVVNLGALGLPAGYGIVMVVLAVVVLLWGAYALVLTSALALRTRDIARLAAHYLAARPASTFGVLSLLVAAVGLIVLTSDWVLVLVSSPLSLLLLHTARPVLSDATERFTA